MRVVKRTGSIAGKPRIRTVRPTRSGLYWRGRSWRSRNWRLGLPPVVLSSAVLVWIVALGGSEPMARAPEPAPGLAEPRDAEPRGSTEPATPSSPTEPEPTSALAAERQDEPLAIERQNEPLTVEPLAPEPVETLPSNLLQMPASSRSALVFDLERNRALVFERAGETLTQVGDYFVSLGKKGIAKTREGDEKTPVGIYTITSYIPGDELPAIYGAGALPLTYPNSWDRRLGRTGSGIWIHGTDKNEESLMPLSSRGCLTLLDQSFLALAEKARIATSPVVVSDRVSWKPATQLEAERRELKAAIETWRQDWESRDVDRYIGHYSRSFRTLSMSLDAWTAHKIRVNRGKRYIRVGIDDLGLYAYPGEPGLYLATFEQRYESNNFNATRRKSQFWRRETGGWRIVHEGD